MPRKDKRKNPRNRATGLTVSEEDDTASIASDMTDPTSMTSEDDTLQIEAEVYEGKIREAMELAQEKSAKTRINALIALKTGLEKRIITGFLLENYRTITDIIERSLKKGKGAEQVAAAKLAMVLTISLQSGTEAEQVFEILYPILLVLLKDPSACVVARKEVASATSLLAFLACPDKSDIPTILNALHDVFCASLPKGNGELPTLGVAMLALHAESLAGVCLLMTLISATTVYSMAQKMLEELAPVLDTTDTDLRINVGEALAMIHESAKVHDEDFRWKRQGKVVERLEEFVTESHKYRGKKDRKTQRLCFREILQTITVSEPLSMIVNIGPANQQQELYIDSWARRFQYQALCHALGHGLAHHMTYNIMLRDLFDLGAPPVSTANKGVDPGSKRSGKQTAEAKARILSRGKNRDNRKADMSYEG